MIRLIARIDLRNGYHIKTIQCEGVNQIRKIEESVSIFDRGNNEHDEIFILDTVASLYESRNWMISNISNHICASIPVTIGGGIRSVNDLDAALKIGADKIALNTAALLNPSIIKEFERIIGQQSIVLQVDTRKISGYYWCFTHGGREQMNVKFDDWVRQASDLGIGEIHVTSIDSEGIDKPFPDELADLCKRTTSLPLIISGGVYSADEIIRLYKLFDINAFSISSLTNRHNKILKSIRNYLSISGLPIRSI